MAVVLIHQGPSLTREKYEALGPILREVGVDDQPEIYEAHTFVSA
jgi:hypothetical protein